MRTTILALLVLISLAACGKESELNSADASQCQSARYVVNPGDLGQGCN